MQCDKVERAIRLHVASNRALQVKNPSSEIEIETEIRLGVLVNSQQKRAAYDFTRFVSNIDKWKFYATFQHLTQHHDNVIAEFSKKYNDNTSYYENFPGVREHQGASNAWMHKEQMMEKFDVPCGPDLWFDIRVATARERIVEKPDGISEAQAIAKRITHPWQDERTRTGFPSFMRHRTRRSLRFVDALCWRVDFTRVQTSQHVVGDDGFGAQYLLANGPELHEIEIEFVGDATPEEAAATGVLIIKRLAFAIGASRREIGQIIARDKHTCAQQSLMTTY